MRTSYLSILSAIVFVSIISYILLSQNAKEHSVLLNRNDAARLLQYESFLVEKVESISRDLAFNKDIQRLLAEYNDGMSQDLMEMRIAIDQVWQNYANIFESVVVNAALFSSNGNLAGSLETFPENVKIHDYFWYGEVADSTGNSIWIESDLYAPGEKKESGTISVVRKVRSLNTSDASIGQDMGYLLILMDVDAMISDFSSGGLDDGQAFFLATEEGVIFYHSDPEQIGKQIANPGSLGDTLNFEGRRYICHTGKIDVAGWYVVCLTDFSLVNQNANLALTVCLLSSSILLIIFLGISIKTAKYLSLPFETLQCGFSRLEEGDFETSIAEATGIAEIDDLMRRFNRMVLRLNDLIDTVYKSQIREQTLISEVRESEIKSLQFQVNPHFLYNTLDTINWMALEAGNEDVSKMVRALGDFFRNNLESESAFATVAQAVKNAELFLYIQKVRFDNRLEYRVEIDPDTEHCVILKLLIQPLVENCLKHGLILTEKTGLITIETVKKEEKIVLVVKDNGRGMNPEVLKKMRNCWENIDRVSPVEGQIGLINIMKRLHLCYRGQADFRMENKSGGGLEIRVTLPRQEKIPDLNE